MNASGAGVRGLGRGRHSSRRWMVIGGTIGCTVVVAMEAAFDLWWGLQQAAVAGIALSLALTLFGIALFRRYPLLFFDLVVAIAANAWVVSGIHFHGEEGFVWA